MRQSISTINADIAQSDLGADGQGIVCAVIATGVDASHPHFETFRNLDLPNGLSHWSFSLPAPRDRHTPVSSRALSRPVDGNGYGTSIAAVIAGESPGDRGRPFRGMAPRCKIMSIDILGETGEASESTLIAALQTIQRMNAGMTEPRVHCVIVPLEVSWSQAAYACGYSPVCVEADRLVSTGVVVVAPAGNRGFDPNLGRSVEGSITDPGNAPRVITVGSTHRVRAREYGASYFSARGPTADGRSKPDLLAPGEKIEVPLAGELSRTIGPTGDRDSTSYAAAHVAGAVAGILSVRSELIGRPQEVKELLMRTAVDLGREKFYQGAGLIDMVAALHDTREASGPRDEPRSPAPMKVFCSYSHLDLALWKEFETHLSPMKRTGLIEVWSDQVLTAGTRWEPEIYRRLDEADIVLLIVSSFFTDSDFCWSKEMTRALDRPTARVIPILARPVDLADTPIADLQIVPQQKRPVASFQDPHEGWAEVAAKIREVVLEMRGPQSPVRS